MARTDGVEVDLATYNAVLDAYARNRQMHSAEAVLGDMGKNGVTPSARSYNTLLKGYAATGALDGRVTAAPVTSATAAVASRECAASDASTLPDEAS